MTVCSPTENSWRPLCSMPTMRMSKPRLLRAWLVQLPVWSAMAGRTLTTMPSSITWRRCLNSPYFWNQYWQANKGTITSLLLTTSRASFANIHPKYLLLRLPTTPLQTRRRGACCRLPSRCATSRGVVPMTFIYSLRTCLRRWSQRKPAKSRPPIPTNTCSSSCWKLLPAARMSSSTFTTITSPRLTYKICSSLPVLERWYEPLRLAGEQFKPCARPYWSQNSTCMSSSSLVTCARYIYPEKWEIKD